MKYSRLLGVILASVLAMASLMPAMAQDEEVPVLILPVNQAQFLPGALFDLAVEVHAEELPENFAVTVNGTPAGDFFGVESEFASWVFDGGEQTSQGTFWRGVTFDEPGMYTVEATAAGTTTSVEFTVREPGNGEAKNVILFVADGGNVGIYTAARLVSRGMTEGTYNDRFTFEKFEEIGLVSTSGVDSILTDSANSMSAYQTGHKSSVNATGVYANTSRDGDLPEGESDPNLAFDDPWVETFAEIAQSRMGMSVGAISTRYVTDATPAALFGHGRERINFTRADYALQAIGMGQVAQRPWTPFTIDVLLGGGARFFIPASVDGSARFDEIDVLSAYEEMGFAIAGTGSELEEIMEGETPERLLGLFSPGDYPYWLDRNVYTDNIADFPDQPGLVDMTMAALDVVSQDEDGFYLMVEAGAVDRAQHPLDLDRAIADTIEFDNAVDATMTYLEENDMLENTLVIVASDHAHSFDVYGVVDVEAFNEAEDEFGQRNAIGLYGDAGFPTYEDADGDGYPDDWAPDRVLAMGKVENPPFTEDFQVSEVPRSPAVRNEDGNVIDNPEDDPNGLPMGGQINNTSSVHTLQDVPIYATGPGSEFFGRSMENIEVFFGMAEAIGMDPRMGEDMAAAPTANDINESGFAVVGALALLAVAAGGFFSIRRRAA